jgi:hypothetical protein
LVTPAAEVSVRAWPGPPGPNPPVGMSPWTTCENSNAGYTWRPSGRRGGASMPCSTGSGEVTCSRRRGGGCARIGERPGWIGRPWRTSRDTAWSGCSETSKTRSERATTARRRCGGGRSRSQMAACGRWASRRSGTVWRSSRRSWCWSRSSRQTSCPRRTATGRSEARPRRWSASEGRSSTGARGFWSWISASTSTPLTGSG